MSEKLFYTMGEVAEMFDVNTSLIRYWESQFRVLRPKRNKKGNRLFSAEDVRNLKRIYHLVKERGMTLEGAKKVLNQTPAEESGMDRDAELAERLQRIRALLAEVREELRDADDPDAVAADRAVTGPAAASRTAAVVVDPDVVGSTADDPAAADFADVDLADVDLADADPAEADLVDADLADADAVADADVDADLADAAADAEGGVPRATRRPRRRKETPEAESKELFAFYEQSLF